MRRLTFVAVLAVAIGLAGCGETTEVESKSVCGERVPTEDGGYVEHCTVEATDERISGPEIQTYFLEYDDDTHESGTVAGEFEITGPDGSWSGTVSGTFDTNGVTAQGEAGLTYTFDGEAVGSGAYKGLTYKFESTADGSGPPTRTGVITSDG